MALPSSFNSTLIIGLVLSLAACGGPEPPADTTPDSDLAIDTTPKDVELLQVGGKVFSVPSPVQSAYAIRKAGLKYQKNITAPLEKAGTTTSKGSQALLLGMLGADMAYVTVHKDGQRALATLQVIEKLGGALELSNAFDRALLERFKSNLGNEDSLLRFSGTAFRAADQYLKDNDRNDVSTLVLVGGWVESLHLTLADPAGHKDEALMDRLGEQRKAVNDLVDLMSAGVQDDGMGPLIKGMKDLQASFSGISATYTYEKPVTDVAQRTTFINSKSSVTISAEQIADIAAKVSAIRSMILV
jgi:predicted small lipoprotein YifL